MCKRLPRMKDEQERTAKKEIDQLPSGMKMNETKNGRGESCERKVAMVIQEQRSEGETREMWKDDAQDHSAAVLTTIQHGP